MGTSTTVLSVRISSHSGRSDSPCFNDKAASEDNLALSNEDGKEELSTSSKNIIINKCLFVLAAHESFYNLSCPDCTPDQCVPTLWGWSVSISIF